ncbi:hypothetical protein GUJ93_ZPchr0004g40087 [Zizania palustris]|uniref:DUF7597 domain-containing protein n=1 Tax=Zizania palustris TaxID=103762 RepID=A0A8J5T1F2_ZIZPA|nr:hypothetical protein GUJ93_ZPchr0004g40087 [Zizania palustris]
MAIVPASTTLVSTSSNSSTSSFHPSPMANFPVDPIPFIPRGGIVLDDGGGLRKRRTVVSLLGQQIKKNEDLAITLCEEQFDALERQEFLQLIHHHITQVLQHQVLRY